MVARPSKDQTSHKSLMKPALNALRLPTGRPGNPEGLPDCPGFHWVALLISVMSGTCFHLIVDLWFPYGASKGYG